MSLSSSPATKVNCFGKPFLHSHQSLRPCILQYFLSIRLICSTTFTHIRTATHSHSTEAAAACPGICVPLSPRQHILHNPSPDGLIRCHINLMIINTLKCDLVLQTVHKFPSANPKLFSNLIPTEPTTLSMNMFVTLIYAMKHFIMSSTLVAEQLTNYLCWYCMP